MAERDGGPAFPIPEQRAFDGAGLVEGHPGMTLRDWFAGQALTGMIPGRHDVGAEPRLAQSAYRYADAMIAARANDGANQ